MKSQKPMNSHPKLRNHTLLTNLMSHHGRKLLYGRNELQSVSDSAVTQDERFAFGFAWGEKRRDRTAVETGECAVCGRHARSCVR